MLNGLLGSWRSEGRFVPGGVSQHRTGPSNPSNKSSSFSAAPECFNCKLEI